jgi:biotin synthase
MKTRTAIQMEPKNHMIWDFETAMKVYESPFPDLMYRAQTIYREQVGKYTMQISTLLNIKDGGCPEDCQYCPQAARYNTGVTTKPLMNIEAVRERAIAAKNAGATRFCMGAAWRELKDKDVPAVSALIKEVNDLGLESCVTLGMLSESQAKALKAAGLDYYNHNVDTSAEFYDKIITTRIYEDRLGTLRKVRDAGIHICSGGILGMGEARADRVRMLLSLMEVDPDIESVTLNRLVPVPGTPLGDQAAIDPLEIVRTIALARIMFPKARVRLSAGRTLMSDELQTLCFLAGANSIFVGDKLLMTKNPAMEDDMKLLQRLGIETEVLLGHD